MLWSVSVWLVRLLWAIPTYNIIESTDSMIQKLISLHQIISNFYFSKFCRWNSTIKYTSNQPVHSLYKTTL